MTSRRDFPSEANPLRDELRGVALRSLPEAVADLGDGVTLHGVDSTT